jgi:tetratricopeptide (TPR) repeat protein
MVSRVARGGLIGVLAIVLFVAAGLGVFRTIGIAREADPITTARTVETTDLLAPSIGSDGGLATTIANLQQRLRDVPGDWRSFASLGLAYVQQARITSDPSFYPKAEGVLHRSLSLQRRDNEVALVGMAALAAARHDFAAALRLGERAREVNPYDVNVYGVIGDAQLELGRYERAFATFQTMVDTKPGLSAYARVSYVRELLGDVPGAIRSMEAARDVAGSGADRAWTSYHLGELRFNGGDLAGAANEYEAGLEADPDFVPNMAGVAKVAWARGDLDRAIAGFREVVERYPSPEYVGTLGDLYRATGKQGLAEDQFDLVRAEAALFAANGVDTDLELALFDADHGDPRAALRAARAEWNRRESIHVADALGWALHRNGHDAEASDYADEALSLGSRNALFLYHAGMIRRGLGEDEEAARLLHRALRINPTFSVQHAPIAERTLARLRMATR